MGIARGFVSKQTLPRQGKAKSQNTNKLSTLEIRLVSHSPHPLSVSPLRLGFCLSLTLFLSPFFLFLSFPFSFDLNNNQPWNRRWVNPFFYAERESSGLLFGVFIFLRRVCCVWRWRLRIPLICWVTTPRTPRSWSRRSSSRPRRPRPRRRPRKTRPSPELVAARRPSCRRSPSLPLRLVSFQGFVFFVHSVFFFSFVIESLLFVRICLSGS